MVKKTFEFHDVLLTYMKFINEIIFERVRVNKFGHSPSRTNCIWLCKEKDIGKWLKMLKGQRKIKVFRVSATGEIHKVDGSWIKVDIYTGE